MNLIYSVSDVVYLESVRVEEKSSASSARDDETLACRVFQTEKEEHCSFFVLASLLFQSYHL